MSEPLRQPYSGASIMTVANPEPSSGSESNEYVDIQSSASQLSSAISNDDTSDLPENISDQDKTNGPDGRESQPKKEVALNIVPKSHLKGLVLFGVHGSKRLRRGKIRMAQVDLEIHKDDDSFFDEITAQYRNLRGYMRWIFSIWCFRTCELIKV